MEQDGSNYVVKKDYRILMNTVRDDHLHTLKLKLLRFLFDIDHVFHDIVHYYVDNVTLCQLIFIIIIPLLIYGIVKILIHFKLYNTLFCLLILFVLKSSFDNNYDFPMFSLH